MSGERRKAHPLKTGHAKQTWNPGSKLLRPVAGCLSCSQVAFAVRP